MLLSDLCCPWLLCFVKSDAFADSESATAAETALEMLLLKTHHCYCASKLSYHLDLVLIISVLLHTGVCVCGGGGGGGGM